MRRPFRRHLQHLVRAREPHAPEQPAVAVHARPRVDERVGAFRVDPRVLFKAPGEHNLTPQDASSGPFYIPFKYPAYATPIRLASKLEADRPTRA